MNLLNSPILGIKLSLHSFTPKNKAINNTHNHNHNHKSHIMMHKRVNSDKLSSTMESLLPDDDNLVEPTTKPCLCGRRHFIEAAATTTLTATQFPVQPATATNFDSDYTVISSLAIFCPKCCRIWIVCFMTKYLYFISLNIPTLILNHENLLLFLLTFPSFKLVPTNNSHLTKANVWLI